MKVKRLEPKATAKASMVLAYLATVCVCVLLLTFLIKRNRQRNKVQMLPNVIMLLLFFFGIFHNICCIGKWIKEKRKRMKRL